MRAHLYDHTDATLLAELGEDERAELRRQRQRERRRAVRESRLAWPVNGGDDPSEGDDE